MSLQGYNEYMERSHSDNALTVGRWVGIAEWTNTLPEYSTMLPVQRIAEPARSNLGEWCVQCDLDLEYQRVSEDRQDSLEIVAEV
jgi:hypothetical protein